MANAIVVPIPSLSEAVSRIGKLINTVNIGPQLVVHDLMNLENRWEHYEPQADGMTFDAWVKRDIGHPSKWWRDLFNAVETLTRRVSLEMATKAVIYLAHTVPDAYRADVLSASLAKKRNEHSGVALSFAEVRWIAAAIVPGSTKVRECLDCEALRAQLRELGAEPKV